jgi:hypothetical protein
VLHPVAFSSFCDELQLSSIPLPQISTSAGLTSEFESLQSSLLLAS